MWRTAALLALLAGPAAATSPPQWCGRLFEPTEDYRHCVLGSCTTYRGLSVPRPAPNSEPALPTYIDHDTILPSGRVFEATRSFCVEDEPGAPPGRVMVVETDVTAGASLAVYGLIGTTLTKLAATPHIGTPNRWLAPVAALDLDGDGRVEYAWVDRPHLAMTLRVARQQGDRLVEIAALPGFSNHRIGETHISSSWRSCEGRIELLVPDASMRRVMAVRLVQGQLAARDAGPFDGPRSFTDLATCPN